MTEQQEQSNPIWRAVSWFFSIFNINTEESPRNKIEYTSIGGDNNPRPEFQYKCRPEFKISHESFNRFYSLVRYENINVVFRIILGIQESKFNKTSPHLDMANINDTSIIMLMKHESNLSIYKYKLRAVLIEQYPMGSLEDNKRRLLITTHTHINENRVMDYYKFAHIEKFKIISELTSSDKNFPVIDMQKMLSSHSDLVDTFITIQTKLCEIDQMRLD